MLERSLQPYRTQLLLLAGLLCGLPLGAHAGGVAVNHFAPPEKAPARITHNLLLQLPSQKLTDAAPQRAAVRLDALRPQQPFVRTSQPLKLDTEASAEEVTRAAFPIHWQNAPDHVSPEFVHIVKRFRHEGLPVVRLWQSGRNLLHVGLNGHGTPGIWFTQTDPN